MQYKNMPERLKKQASSIFNKNERLATQVVDNHPVSVFDHSFRHMTTLNSGYLVPIYVKEALPGDIFNIDIKAILRLGTPQAATMENAIFDINFYFVGNTKIWDGWKYFMGETKNAGYQEDYDHVPQIIYDANVSYNENDLASYMGFPMNISMQNTDVPINSLPFKAYIKIWNDYYRDENLQSEIDNTNNNDNDSDVKTSNYVNADPTLQIQIGKGLATTSRLPDYFSTCLPWPQKGEAVNIESLSIANLMVSGNVINDASGGLSMIKVYTGDGNVYPFNKTTTDGTVNVNGSVPQLIGVQGNTGEQGVLQTYNAPFDQANSAGISYKTYIQPENTGSGTIYQRLKIDPNTTTLSYKDDTGQGQVYSVNDLRMSLAIQHMRELDARGGSRYIEYILNHFGVQSSDVRLQRAELIGGYRDYVQIDNIVQSSNGTSESPLGVIGGVSVTTTQNPATVNYAVEEHGWIIGVITIRSNISYSQGLDKQFTRTEKIDYYDPLLANIGEQPVKKYELFLGRNNNDGTSTNMDVFGYNEPWSDYRYAKNYLSGYVSVNSATSLSKLYAYTEKYGSAPTLTGEWMTYDPSIVGDTQLLNGNSSEFIHQFLADFYFDVSKTSKMPVYSIPGLKKV